MNNSTQAKNGFKSFILTLSISLAVFGLIYYLATYSTQSNVDIEDMTPAQAETSTELSANTNMGQVVRESVFEDLKDQEVNVPKREVLAGTDEVTESTVPETGSTEITISLLLSVIIAALGGYLLFIGPRKKALDNFERRVKKNF
ncbi:MAG: hypothetical protein UU80_C0035G0003 [candidate division WWE3 bacterium GW2011_GWA1_41_8]|uniref:Gram-positive cocci surface proteins LPxTG domain-containing protein n=2 Tax=Katanobacteria TaxID=422282 RepID=A0A0G1A6V9_UNCKA|nr:MAG: hypothetical protein UU80_C0035G0003 [candidate division WWE3 bacterium GW2011_GWA1_41_8]OGC57829.1 MAG: hypothetical protein A2976_01915 [candidate division WWE3 bacterium RIFCSPLOWO2_01_FULL_41_9]